MMCQVRHGRKASKAGDQGTAMILVVKGAPLPIMKAQSGCNKPPKWRPANDNKIVWSSIPGCQSAACISAPFPETFNFAPTQNSMQSFLHNLHFRLLLHFRCISGVRTTKTWAIPISEWSSGSIADVRVAILMQFLCARFRLPIFYLTPPFRCLFSSFSAIYFLSCAIIAVCLSLDCSLWPGEMAAGSCILWSGSQVCRERKNSVVFRFSLGLLGALACLIASFITWRKRD